MDRSHSAGLGRRSLLKSAAGGLGLAVGAAAGVTSATAAAAPEKRPNAETREYWIQADNLLWNVVPNGKDNMMGTTYTAANTSYTAIGYRAYTPGWQAPLPASTGLGANNGVPGPIIRANVGDTIIIHFRNNDRSYNWPHSIHPHGVRYTPDSDGSWMADDPMMAGTAVMPGESYTYTYTCPPSSVGTWVYHDHSKPMPNLSGQPNGAMAAMELGAMMGLYGFIVVADPTQQPADKEFFLFMSEFWSSYMPIKTDLMGFNGYAFVDNAPTVTAKVGQRVRWHVATLGLLPHVFHVHGHRWCAGGRYTDAQSLGPSESLVFDWVEDNPGSWMYHCHYPDHFAMGMAGRYVVTA
jgi:FtsP/CotA-like multicopper oxidase with cupredoxin domain